MSVLRCDRNGCENIMCDRYSNTHGYICNECFKELVESGADTNIYKFMRSLKNKIDDSQETAFEKFDRIFPN